MPWTCVRRKHFEVQGSARRTEMGGLRSLSLSFPAISTPLPDPQGRLGGQEGAVLLLCLLVGTYLPSLAHAEDMLP